MQGAAQLLRFVLGLVGIWMLFSFVRRDRQRRATSGGGRSQDEFDDRLRRLKTTWISLVLLGTLTMIAWMVSTSLFVPPWVPTVLHVTAWGLIACGFLVAMARGWVRGRSTPTPSVKSAGKARKRSTESISRRH